jgi:hypothetical protein
MNSEIARRWLAATFVTYIVSAILAVVVFGVRKALSVDDADAALSAKAAYVAIDTVSLVIYFALYAQMTGPVLRLIVPALRQQSWLKIHIALGLIFAVPTGLLVLLPAGDEAVDLSDTSLRAANALGAVIVGVIIGGVQANVLRRVAYGVGAWIATVTIAMVVTTLVAVDIAQPLPKEQTLAGEVANQGILVLLRLLGATLMLPALWRLRARTI